ncbi:hypothetical protein B0T18DRAFT_399595 [Schizothecium vesticola]|uniref:Uncharacterized protein n=1 Tax=Schizothecium vesticola TaxID=314040 RepID=A0AA40KCZ5_9PEZI|nr:hypothetical protein B0T18DRAFT_399595 [Schizothecium vesticola]
MGRRPPSSFPRQAPDQLTWEPGNKIATVVCLVNLHSSKLNIEIAQQDKQSVFLCWKVGRYIARQVESSAINRAESRKRIRTAVLQPASRALPSYLGE